MLYSKEELESKCITESYIDFDWYSVDNDDNVAIIASGGGLIPSSIIQNANYDSIISYFRTLPSLSSNIILKEFAINEIITMNDIQRNAYLKDVNLMVGKGLYYFDKALLNNYYDFTYCLKAKPQVSIKFHELNSEIKTVLSTTRINVNFNEINNFNVSLIK